MSITISISEKTEKKIRRQAAKSGQDVNKVVGNLVEEVWDERFPESGSNGNIEAKDGNEEFVNPFTPFIACSQAERRIRQLVIRKFFKRTLICLVDGAASKCRI